MLPFVSVIIPNRNGAATLAASVTAARRSRYPRLEVIVVDDASRDASVETLRDLPCKLVRLPRHRGAGAARNAGARRARGDVLFFTDADCLLEAGTLMRAVRALARAGPAAAVGGTYTWTPADGRFFSRFQSVFVHYWETRRAHPDYLATHALAIGAADFRASGGFRENFLPILEDVEFSHRLRRLGYRLVMSPRILVRHVFNYSAARSLRNAFRKSMYWTIYSLGHGDLLADSGTASAGLKLNVATGALSAVLLVLLLATGHAAWLAPLALLWMANLRANHGLLRAFCRTHGPGFALAAALYYLLVYPLAVAAGAAAGLLRYPRTASALRGGP